METNTPRWIIDDGHGWLAVSLADYPEAVRCGTGFGYQHAGVIYPEEDCEADAFLTLHPEIEGHALPVERVNGSWKGRGYRQNARRYAPLQDGHWIPITEARDLAPEPANTPRRWVAPVEAQRRTFASRTYVEPVTSDADMGL